MKRLLSFMLCASLFFVFGCNPKPEPTPEPTPDPVLSVSPESLAFTAEGGAQNVQVKANNPWTASASGTGISVNPSSGDGNATVTVTAAATNSTDPITGTVSFRSGGLSASVSITQEERKVIQVGDVMTIPAEGGSFAVDVQYNTDVVVEVESAAQSWITFVAVRALQSGKLEFQFAENSSTDPRQGTVTVKDKNGKVSPITLTFVQEEKKVISVGDVMTIPAEGGTFAVDVQYNTDVVVEVESTAQSWITFVAVRALASGKLEFQFAENSSTDPRQGTVTVKDKNGKVSPITLTFVQEEKKVIAVGDVMEIPAEGGTFAVDVQYNTDVVVEVESAAQSWITFVAVRALASGKLEFRFAENSSTDPRQGKVTVKDKNGKVSPITLTFKQAEKKVIAVGDVMEIPAEGGTFEVDVQYNTEVVVEIESSAQSWIHFVAVRVLTSGKLEFQFDANPNPDVRTGKVTVKDKNGKVSPITLTFVQEEKKVITVGDVMEIPAEGGTFSVDVQYNTDRVIVEVDSEAPWIHYIQIRALKNGIIDFRFDANPNPDVRTGKVTVKDRAGKVNPITLTFVQAENKIAQEEIRIKNALMQIYNAMDGPNWNIPNKWDLDKDLRQWSGVTWKPNTGELSLSINNFGLKGQLPDCFDDLSSCVQLWIQNEPGLTGTLPASFSKLKRLGVLVISNTSMTSLPDVFSGMPLWFVAIENNLSMAGQVPESLGESDGLMGEESLDGIHVPKLIVSDNGFAGTIPESWLRLGSKVVISNHKFSGQIPDYFYSAKDPGYWINMYINHGQTDQEYRKTDPFSVQDRDIPGYWPERGLNDVITGKPIPYDDIISGNKATVVYKWASWCNYSAALLPLLKKMHEKYHKDGLEVILRPAWGDSEGEKILKDYVLEHGYDIWYNFSSEDISFTEEAALGSFGTPFANVIDNKGNVIFSCAPNVSDPSRRRFGYNAFNNLIPFLEDIFGPLEDGEEYASTDYSMDGTVVRLQEASVGKGINIVFMGDAYTDRDMNDLYESLMWQAAEEFFEIEPYKTFRNRFNVYTVRVVSKNGKTGTGYSTALGTQASGSSISINDAGTNKCYEYALKVPGINDKKNLLICVLVNSSGLSGITAMSESLQSGVAYCSSGRNIRDIFGVLVRHEAGGHGFAFLSDEYSTQTGSPSQAMVNEYNRLYSNYGWYSNVDFTSDPSKVKWSVFLNDNRYKDEVGIFEGGANFTNGVFRPSQNSMMNQNMERFNAPSRWAIYKRIMELSGETASFEKFLEYDAVNRASASSAPRPPLKAAAAPERKIVYSAPPVVVP